MKLENIQVIRESYPEFNLAFERTEPIIFYQACKEGKQEIIDILITDERIFAKLNLRRASRKILKITNGSEDRWELIYHLHKKFHNAWSGTLYTELDQLNENDYFYSDDLPEDSWIAVKTAIKYKVQIENNDICDVKHCDEDSIIQLLVMLADVEGQIDVIKYLKAIVENFEYEYWTVFTPEFADFIYETLTTEEDKRSFFRKNLFGPKINYNSIKMFKWLEQTLKKDDLIKLINDRMADKKKDDVTYVMAPLDDLVFAKAIEFFEYFCPLIPQEKKLKNVASMQLEHIRDSASDFVYLILGQFKIYCPDEYTIQSKYLLQEHSKLYQSEGEINAIVDIYTKLQDQNFPISKLKYVYYFASDVYQYLQANKHSSILCFLPIEIVYKIIFQYVSSVGDELTLREKELIIDTLIEINREACEMVKKKREEQEFSKLENDLFLVTDESKPMIGTEIDVKDYIFGLQNLAPIKIEQEIILSSLESKQNYQEMPSLDEIKKESNYQEISNIEETQDKEKKRKSEDKMHSWQKKIKSESGKDEIEEKIENKRTSENFTDPKYKFLAKFADKVSYRAL